MIKKPLTDIEFYEMKNGSPVQVSTNSKKARGEMARHIITQKISSKEKIKEIRKISGIYPNPFKKRLK